MHEELFGALEQGATVITAGRRLSRTLTQQFHSRQRTAGRSVWNRPDIVPLDSFLERTWHSWVLRGATGSCPRLLGPLEEQVAWEQIIGESPAGGTLLHLGETARNAIEAWRLIQAYRLPVDGRFEATGDSAAFRNWARVFRNQCDVKHWLEPARLSDLLLARMAAGEVQRPSIAYIAGFDDVTPQQAELFECLACRRERDSRKPASSVECRSAVDAREEIRSVASWARRLLEVDPETQIGVIVPDLAWSRPTVERIFREALDPAGHSGNRDRQFHVSLGPPLGEHPLVRGALLVLEFGLGRIPLPRAGALLRSPFLGGAESEWSDRALLDARLRKRGVWDVTVTGLREAAARCRLLQRGLSRFAEELEKLPEAETAAGWTRSFSRLLEILGWPGERSLSGQEHQAREAWQEMLSSLSTLDVVAAPMSFDQALARLQDIAAHTPFQVENEGAPIQIMGMLEAAGLDFDHLWIMGLSDNALPGPANPNPFVPLSLQREHKLPHSSAERELEFAKNLMERLLSSATDVVVSHPRMEGDRVLSVSPLAPTGPWHPAGHESLYTNWISRIRSAARIEELRDERAPSLAVGTTQPGGAFLFKDMSACPFRAFAKYRLGARPFEQAIPGLTAKDQGNGVHKALELIWRELESHARLVELRSEEVRELVARNVRKAVDQLRPGLGRNLERRRLENLLVEWLEIEKSRDPFVVAKREDERLVTIGGLQVRVRADRVDALPGGREIILDYKTGVVRSTGWEGDRPDEPQLPLYCVTNERPVAAAAFALVRTGELGFRGLASQDASLPRMKKMSSREAIEGEIPQWKTVLEALAERFRAGAAEVDPKSGACENCGLTALCRIRELDDDLG